MNIPGQPPGEIPGLLRAEIPGLLHVEIPDKNVIRAVSLPAVPAGRVMEAAAEAKAIVQGRDDP